jgi:hypothetical protein
MCTRAQVQANVKCATAALESPTGDTVLLDEVNAILAPVKNTTWPSGRPENNVAPTPV